MTHPGLRPFVGSYFTLTIFIVAAETAADESFTATPLPGQPHPGYEILVARDGLPATRLDVRTTKSYVTSWIAELDGEDGPELVVALDDGLAIHAYTWNGLMLSRRQVPPVGESAEASKYWVASGQLLAGSNDGAASHYYDWETREWRALGSRMKRAVSATLRAPAKVLSESTKVLSAPAKVLKKPVDLVRGWWDDDDASSD